jgi:hypothetical protein
LVSYTSGHSCCATVLDLGYSRLLADIQWIQVSGLVTFQGDAAGDVAMWYRAQAQSYGTILIRRVHCLLIFLGKLSSLLDWSVVRQSLILRSKYNMGTRYLW